MSASARSQSIQSIPSDAPARCSFATMASFGAAARVCSVVRYFEFDNQHQMWHSL